MNLVYLSILLDDMIALEAGEPGSKEYEHFHTMLEMEKSRRAVLLHETKKFEEDQ